MYLRGRQRMDPREMETLIQRLVANPHDEEALAYAHRAGTVDPRSYAILLEKVGQATADPAYAAHWLSEAANVWSTTIGDAHHAARTLMIAIEKDPTARTAPERLAQLYRDKGDLKALVALLERLVKSLAPLATHDRPDVRAQLIAMHEELGRLWGDQPFSRPERAVENWRRVAELDPQNAYAIYAAREMLKAAQQWADAVQYFGMEQAIVDDPERKLALYRDEADVRGRAGDGPGKTQALRGARALQPDDVGLKQEVGSSVLERIDAGENVPAAEREEAAQNLRPARRVVRRQLRHLVLRLGAQGAAGQRPRDAARRLLRGTARPHRGARSAVRGLPPGQPERVHERDRARQGPAHGRARRDACGSAPSAGAGHARRAGGVRRSPAGSTPFAHRRRPGRPGDRLTVRRAARPWLRRRPSGRGAATAGRAASGQRPPVAPRRGTVRVRQGPQAAGLREVPRRAQDRPCPSRGAHLGRGLPPAEADVRRSPRRAPRGDARRQRLAGDAQGPAPGHRRDLRVAAPRRRDRHPGVEAGLPESTAPTSRRASSSAACSRRARAGTTSPCSSSRRRWARPTSRRRSPSRRSSPPSTSRSGRTRPPPRRPGRASRTWRRRTTPPSRPPSSCTRRPSASTSPRRCSATP